MFTYKIEGKAEKPSLFIFLAAILSQCGYLFAARILAIPHRLG
jgi:hypothetical protein